MREVSVCDFCGESAAGTFEVLPAGIDGEEPKRMVLCPDCEATLSEVVEPLLDALDGGGEPLVAEAEPAVVSEPEPEASEPDAEPEETDGGSTATEPRSSSGNTRTGTPKGYSKVMRFLEGRAFPMEREEAEAMAAEAYEMDPRAVSAAIDHAAKHGRVRVASGKLFQ